MRAVPNFLLAIIIASTQIHDASCPIPSIQPTNKMVSYICAGTVQLKQDSSYDFGLGLFCELEFATSAAGKAIFTI